MLLFYTIKTNNIYLHTNVFSYFIEKDTYEFLRWIIIKLKVNITWDALVINIYLV